MIKKPGSIFFILCVLACNNNPNDSRDLQVTMLQTPAGASSMAPYLFTSPGNVVYLSWIEKDSISSNLKYSSLQHGKWVSPVNIISGEDWFVNWADYPQLAANEKGQMLAHYLEKTATGTYTYDIKMLTSATNGKEWSPSFVLHDDGKKAEHGFVSMVPYGNHFFVSWLDGRNSALPEGMDHSSHEGHSMGAMTLRAAIIDINGKKLNEWELDDRVCDCCQTNTAITGEGPVVVYRDRSEDEVRDIAIVRYVNGKWTAPQLVHKDNWKIEGCPVNGPRITALKNSMAIAWFTSPENNSKVSIIFSEDGGKSFTPPVRVDEGKAIGRVDVELLDDHTALVSWMEGALIKMATVDKNGKKGESISIATSSTARSSGFPQMTKSGNHVYFAWVDDQEKKVNLAMLTL